MEIQIQAKHIAAVSHGTADKDARYYLDGVHFTTSTMGIVNYLRVESTNGHVAIRSTTDVEMSDDSLDFIVRFTKDQLRDLRKKANADVVVTLSIADVDGTMALSGTVSPIVVVDGKFPDMDKIWPVNPEGKLADKMALNLSYLAVAGKAEVAMTVRPSDHPVRIHHNDSSAVLLEFMGTGAEGLSMVIMPVRCK